MRDLKILTIFDIISTGRLQFANLRIFSDWSDDVGSRYYSPNGSQLFNFFLSFSVNARKWLPNADLWNWMVINIAEKPVPTFKLGRLNWLVVCIHSCLQWVALTFVSLLKITIYAEGRWRRYCLWKWMRFFIISLLQYCFACQHVKHSIRMILIWDKLTTIAHRRNFLCFSDETFSYFGYGSNLLAARIHLQNPSAVFRAIARLDGYRLEFDRDKSEVWRGASATITESPDDHVWGVVWTMNKADLASLDIQEGVDSGIYEVCAMFCRMQCTA